MIGAQFDVHWQINGETNNMSHSADVGDGVAGSTESLTKSELHWLFAAPRCKTTLEALDELTLPVNLETVATAVAEMEANGKSVDSDTVDEVAISLHHTHLPKMDRLGVIRYDPEEKLIGEAVVAPTP